MRFDAASKERLQAMFATRCNHYKTRREKHVAAVCLDRSNKRAKGKRIHASTAKFHRQAKPFIFLSVEFGCFARLDFQRRAKNPT